MTTTTNYNLNKPVKGQSGWDVQINENMDIVDEILGSHESQLADKQTQIDNLVDNKADIAYVNTEIQNMNSQVQGFYTTVSNLTTAFPTGNSNNYVVTADNYIYRWNGSSWVSTGYLWNANGVANGAITSPKLSSDVQDAIFTLNEIETLQTISEVADHYAYKSGSIINTATTSGFYYAVINVNVDEKYEITGGVFSSDTYLVAFTDNSNNFISGEVQGTGSSWTNKIKYEITVPTGATKMYVNKLGTGIQVYKITTAYDQKIGDMSALPTYKNSKIVDAIDEVNTIVKRVSKAYPLPTGIASTGSITTDNYRFKNNNKSCKWTTQNSTDGTVTFSGLGITCKTTDKVGIWVFLEKNICDASTGTDPIISVTFDSYVSADMYPGYRLHPGWNYISFTPNLTSINTLTFTVKHSNTVYNLWFDSIELNYCFTKPVIMLGFDNCQADIYTVTKALLDQYGFKGTFALQSGSIPNTSGDLNTSSGVLSMAQFKDMMKNGWDYAIYRGLGTQPSTNTDISYKSDWINYLQAYLTALETVGIFNPIAYFSPGNISTSMLIEAEKEVGFRLNRRSYSIGIEYFDKDVFETDTIGLIDSNIANVKALIDSTIANNKAISIFSHQIETGTTLQNSVNTLQSSWVSILDYIKTYVDAGAVEVITYREFYQRFAPHDYANYMHNRYEKEKQYILSKIV